MPIYYNMKFYKFCSFVLLLTLILQQRQFLHILGFLKKLIKDLKKVFNFSNP